MRSVNFNIPKEIHRNHNEETGVKLKTEETWPVQVCLHQKDTLRAHFNIYHKELEETTLEWNSCDNTCTPKDTLRMHKGVKHKSKLSNCDGEQGSCNAQVQIAWRARISKETVWAVWLYLPDYSRTKPNQTTGGLLFCQNAEYWGLERPQAFKCALRD